MDRQAYVEHILDHFEHPRHKHRLPDADVQLGGGNPGCGDLITVYLKVGADDRIEAISFEGEGCTISQAGTSIIAEMADGKSTQEFEDMGYEEIVELMGKDVVMSRVRCATVGLGTLKAGLKELRARQIRSEPHSG